MRILVLVLGAMAIATTAQAQGVTDSAAAERLFQDGKALLKAGRTAEACDAFEGSQRLEPRPTTLLNLANCRERNGQLATAWGLYLQVASALRSDASNAELAKSARDKAAAVEPRLSYLIVQVPDDSRAEGLVITRNEAPIDRALWNRGQPLDGGRYTIAARAGGREPWSTEVVVAPELDKQSIVVPRLAELRVTPVPAPAVAPVAGVEASRGTGMPVRRKVAIGFAGAAVAALAGAIAFELSGRSTYDRYEDLTTPSTERDELYDRANRKHQLSQGLGVVGVASAAAAIVLWVTAPSSAPRRSSAFVPAVHAGSSFASVTFERRF